MQRNRYLCFQRTMPEKSPERGRQTPEQQSQMFSNFKLWSEKYKGNIVDMGGRLGGGGVVSSVGEKDTPVHNKIGGYMILEADSLSEALKIAQESPGTAMTGSYVEVREIVVN